MGFSGDSVSKEYTCNAGDLGLIPELGRSPEEGNGNPLKYLAWRIPWTEEPGGLQSMGSQRDMTEQLSHTQHTPYMNSSGKGWLPLMLNVSCGPPWDTMLMLIGRSTCAGVCTCKGMCAVVLVDMHILLPYFIYVTIYIHFALRVFLFIVQVLFMPEESLLFSFSTYSLDHLIYLPDLYLWPRLPFQAQNPMEYHIVFCKIPSHKYHVSLLKTSCFSVPQLCECSIICSSPKSELRTAFFFFKF